MAAKRIGFVGASGLMGHGMAGSLLRRQFPVTVLARPQRPRVRLEDLIAAGAKEAPTPALVAKQSDVMILCVTGAAEVEETVFGPSGIVEGAQSGLFVVDATTSEVSSSTKTREALAKRGIIFVDAPLTRTPAAAELGKANTMVGANPDDFKALLPIFEAYCENVVYAGPPGHGLVLKLINNFIGQAITTATAEGLATAAKTGLDTRALFRVLSSGSVDNKMMSFMIEPMLNAKGDEKLSGLLFSLSNAMKDLRAYTHLTESLCLPSTMGEAVHQSLVTANCLGLGDKYIASLITAQEKLTGVKIVPEDKKSY